MARATDEDTDRIEAERLARRRDVRDQIARRDEKSARAALIRRRLEDLDREVDQAVEAHRVACEPIQAELAKVEASLIAHMTDRRRVPAELEKRRVALIGELDVANEALAAATARARRLRDEPARQLAELGQEVAADSGLELKLAAPPLASPALLAAHFVADQAAEWASARLDKARRRVAENTERAADAARRKERGEERVYQARLFKWQAELAASAAALEAARAAANEAHRRLVDE
jgi:hypothetical protein